MSAQTKVHYITPSPDIPCPEDPCLTLSQFAANSSKYTGQLSLIFLPGNHTLNRELVLSGADNVSMKSQQNETVIECTSANERFIVNETTSAAIKGIHFIGCGGNIVTRVEELVVEDTIFQGVEGEGRATALVLNEVNFTKIRECSFISNTPGNNSERHCVGEFIRDQNVLRRLRLEEDDLVSVGGALLTTSSNVSVTNTKFVHNEAEIGGVLLAIKSIISISQCTYSYNRALYSGGVMATVESSVDIDNSIFSKNLATHEYSIGGVMYTSDGTLNITNSTFNNNSAASGGVMCTSGGSFNITSSTFNNNSADEWGGVMRTSGGSFNITSSTFNNNSAASGGVIGTFNGLFNVTNSTFNNNSAASGGVIGAMGGSFNITSSTFNNNSAESGGVMRTSDGSFSITSSTFNNNSADSGGVIGTMGGSFNITNSTFNNNSATYGGVMRTSHGSFSITSSTFKNNSAAEWGGVVYTSDGSFKITGSTFNNNSATYGGVIDTSDGSFNIASSTFNNNSATYGGVIGIFDGSFNITSSTFNNNSAHEWGGVMDTSGGSFNITSSTFNNNSAASGGVIGTFNGLFDVTSSTFNNNSAASGGVVGAMGGSFNITSSTFNNNSADSGGVMRTSDGSFSITSSTFNNNSADSGGVIGTMGGSFNITSSTFNNNSATYGGVMRTSHGSFSITSSTFKNNSATYGGVIDTSDGSFNIASSTFNNNSATYGGVIETFDGSFNITISTFNNNSAAQRGGVMDTSDGSFNITSSTFNNNSAAQQGGVMDTSDGSFNITSSTFNNNSAAQQGGVMDTSDGSFNITSSTFNNNSAIQWGGVMATYDGSFKITNSTFNNNSADNGGVMRTLGGSFNSTSSTFNNNSAAEWGGVMYTLGGSFNIITNSSFTINKANVGGVIRSRNVQSFIISNSSFNDNSADSYGGIMFTIQCSIHITDSTFHYNSGSLYTSNGNLTFSGKSKLENGVEPSNKISLRLTLQEGGALTSYQSIITFNGDTSLLTNQARQGGAILAIGSTIMSYGTTTIANNTATDSSGGGVSLQQSNLDIRGSCSISDNYAMRGGGVHAKSSTITVYQQGGTLQFTNNSAENGGGLYLELNPKLYTLKDDDESRRNLLIFTSNHGNYGGAVYVADDTNSGACSPNIECFIQTLAQHQISFPYSSINTVNIQFSGNTATEHGHNLFGGLLDRCVPRQTAEVYQQQPNLTTQYYTGVNYLQDLSNIGMDSIASPPVRVCFCDNESKPDCSYQPPPIKVKKGETFKVSLVAVDQVNHSVEANIISSLAHGGGFSEGQQTQSAGRNCTDLTFNVFSQRDNESINLYADGPCGSSSLSIRKLDIQFLDCTCPVGFQRDSDLVTSCVCICDLELSPYITNCNIETRSIIRENTNSWITYINDTDPPGYAIHPNCPFDYCQPQTDNVSINLNLPNGADAQCAFNRTGTLCGACQKHLSLSLGSSRCLPCPSHWPAVFVVILLAATIAGVLLVTALLALNMTVAVGLINGFIFYANIMSVNSALFFPSSEPSFPTVFVTWLNLDLGIDVCFFDGLDAYIKTWLQLAFPVYIISLVVIIIIVSEYSPRFADLIGRKDPVATLATLILLSYAKLLSITITALSSADISYPDGSHKTVWLPDSNVKYFRGKHAALVIVALLIILVGVPYTILLLLWQWIVRAPRWKVFKWTRNTKLNAFIAVYHVPYNSKYRYWTGLLLLVRVILYITASVTVSANPEVSLLATIILVGGLIYLKSIMNLVFKKSITNIVETTVYFNLFTLAFSMYNFKTDLKKQTAVAYTSTIITLLLLVGVIAYHVYLLIRKEKIPVELNEYPLAPVKPATAQVTHSVVEVHKPQCPPPEDDSDEMADIQVREIVVTDPAYQ